MQKNNGEKVKNPISLELDYELPKVHQETILDIYKNITDEEKLMLNQKTIQKNAMTNKLILPLIKSNAELNKKLEYLNHPAVEESLQIKIKKLKKFKNKRDYLITEENDETTLNSNHIKFPENYYLDNESLKNINHYSKIGEKAEHPAKILIPKHFPLIRKPNNSNKLNINFNVFNNENFPNDTKNEFGSVLKGDKQVRNSFLRSLGHLVKYKQYMLNSMNYDNNYYPLQGNNFYRDNDKISEGEEESYRDRSFDNMSNNFTERKAPFNNQSKNLLPAKFPMHSNLTNSFLASNLTTEQNLIKGKYLNEQVTIQKKDDTQDYLKMLSKNGGIYKKLIKKFNM